MHNQWSITMSILLLSVVSCTSEAFEPLPNAPELLAPEPNLVTEEVFIDFAWEPVAEARQYLVLIDDQPVLTTTETTATLNIRPRDERVCWQVVAQDTLMQFPSVIQCLQVQAPEICADSPISLSWPAQADAASYTVTLSHVASNQSITETTTGPSLTLVPDLPNGDTSWTAFRVDAAGQETEIGGGLLVRRASETVSNLRLFPSSANGPIRASWKGQGPFEAEYRAGTCQAPGEWVEGWPRAWGNNQLSFLPGFREPGQEMVFRVRSVAGDCPGEFTCQRVEPKPDPCSQDCSVNAVTSLTWHDATPENFVIPDRNEVVFLPPSIVYNESSESFLMLFHTKTLRLQVLSNLEIVLTELDVNMESVFGGESYAHTSGLVYDPVLGVTLAHSAGDYFSHHGVYFLDMRHGEPWKTLPNATGDQPFWTNGHAAVIDPVKRRMVMYGGAGEIPPFPEDRHRLWAMDLDINEARWEKLESKGDVPEQWGGFSRWYDACNHRMMLFGGVSSPPVKHHNEVYALDLETDTWEFVPTFGDLPKPRDHFAGAQCGCYHFVSHGQTDYNHYLKDTYVLVNNEEWVKPEIHGENPDYAKAMSAAWDPVNEVLLVVGGWSTGLGGVSSQPIERIHIVTGFGDDA